MIITHTRLQNSGTGRESERERDDHIQTLQSRAGRAHSYIHATPHSKHSIEGHGLNKVKMTGVEGRAAVTARNQGENT